MWWERPHSNCTEAKANGDCDIPADSPYYQATPTGSNEPLYGHTDTKSPMVYSWMVHVAGRKVRPAMMTKWQAQAAEEQRRLRPKLFGAKE